MAIMTGGFATIAGSVMAAYVGILGGTSDETRILFLKHLIAASVMSAPAGFVMATGEVSNGETARLEVRKALIEQDYVDCIVQLTGQLFANTQKTQLSLIQSKLTRATAWSLSISL